jgi:hypothetical protein
VKEILNVTSESSLPYQDYVKMNTSNSEERIRWFSVDARRIQDPVTGSNVWKGGMDGERGGGDREMEGGERQKY